MCPTLECCDDTFESYELLTEHLTIRHGLRVNQFKRVTCCSKSLTDVEEFERHKEEDAGHIECNVCPFLTKDDSAHKLHMLEKHEDEASVREGEFTIDVHKAMEIFNAPHSPIFTQLPIL